MSEHIERRQTTPHRRAFDVAPWLVTALITLGGVLVAVGVAKSQLANVVQSIELAETKDAHNADMALVNAKLDRVLDVVCAATPAHRACR